MRKDLNQWNKVKKQLNEVVKPPLFQEREIWWCSAGMNVGFEIYGKGEIFARPVIVLKKFSHYTFLGAPMTSKTKIHLYRYPFTFKEKEGAFLFDQIRTYDSRRLANLMGKVTTKQFLEIKEAMKILL